jgi:hypothetical protein
MNLAENLNMKKVGAKWYQEISAAGTEWEKKFFMHFNKIYGRTQPYEKITSGDEVWVLQCNPESNY